MVDYSVVNWVLLVVASKAVSMVGCSGQLQVASTVVLMGPRLADMTVEPRVERTAAQRGVLPAVQLVVLTVASWGSKWVEGKVEAKVDWTADQLVGWSGRQLADERVLCLVLLLVVVTADWTDA